MQRLVTAIPLLPIHADLINSPLLESLVPGRLHGSEAFFDQSRHLTRWPRHGPGTRTMLELRTER